MKRLAPQRVLFLHSSLIDGLEESPRLMDSGQGDATFMRRKR